MKRIWRWMLGVCLLTAVCLSAATRIVAAPKRPTDTTPFKKPINLVYSPQLTNLLTSLDRLSSRSYTLKPDQVIRVLLERDASAVTVQHTGTVYVYALDRMKRYKFEGPHTLSARMKNGKVQVGWITSAQAIVIDPQTSVNLTFQNRVYNGVLVLIPKDNMKDLEVEN